MPPTLALVLWAVLLLALLRFDPAKEPGTSVALWIPLIWLFIMGSRLPSQWLGTGPRIAAQALEEGNPLDRSIFSGLILLALVVLTLRSFSWGGFISRNLFLIAFLLFAFASVFWSDFPFVSLKRWFRDLGNYLIILVVLSDPHPMGAVRTLFRRLAYLLIPLCIVLDKYFPNLSKQYDGWSGIAMYVGATTGKNLLGLLALLSGLFFIWDTVTRWSARKDRATKRIIQVNLAFIVMSLWLLITANSATCRVCMLIGCTVVLAVHSAWGKRHRTLIRVLIPATFCLYLIVAFGLGASGQLAAAVGKDPTLTDRTKIWSFVLSMHTNPLVGTGYESFWLGPRLEYFWQISGLGGLNEAHNGYLEVYLNLGIIGLLLICAFLLASYRNISKQFATHPDLASLNLALWAIMLFYNVTEAGFRGGLMWLVFLLGGVAVRGRSADQGHGTLVSKDSRGGHRLPSPRLGVPLGRSLFSSRPTTIGRIR
jgi:exopolysaccharide production protein ExoQ